MPRSPEVFASASGPAAETVLTDEMLARFAKTGAAVRSRQRVLRDDFDELAPGRISSRLAVPAELGGAGLSLAGVAQQQRRLGYYAAPTALAINMHLYWTGIAADLWRAGDRSQRWLLEAAAAGEVFAAGHAESGNDIPMLLSTTKAERVEGGYRFTGRKSFGSLSPVWTYLGIHGMDTSDPSQTEDRPRVHAARHRRLSHRADVGRARDARDAQRRHDPGRRLRARSLRRPGRARRRRRHRPVRARASSRGRCSGSATSTTGSPAVRSIVTIDTVKSKRSIALTRSMAYHAELQHRVAQMGLAFESIGPHLDRIAEDWSNGVDHGAAWPAKIFAAKFHAVEESWRIVDLALEVAGGFGIFRKSGLEQLFRDARLGRIHPANSMLTHEIVGEDAARDQPGRNAAVGIVVRRTCVGLISSAISEIRSAGRPARRACSRIASMLGASYSQ